MAVSVGCILWPYRANICQSLPCRQTPNYLVLNACVPEFWTSKIQSINWVCSGCNNFLLWFINESKSPQVSRTFLSILVDLSNAMVCIISFLLLIFKHSSLFSKHSVTVQSWYMSIFAWLASTDRSCVEVDKNNVPYEFLPASPVMSIMIYSSYSNDLWHGR